MAKKKALSPADEKPPSKAEAVKAEAVKAEKKPAATKPEKAAPVQAPAASPAQPTPIAAAQSAEKKAEPSAEKPAESKAFQNLKAGIKKPAALGGQFAKPFNLNAKKNPAGFNNQNARSQIGRSGTNTGVPRRTGGG